MSWVIAVSILLPHLIPLVRFERAGPRSRSPHTKALHHVFWAIFITFGYTIPLFVVLFCYGGILKGIYLDRTVLGVETTNATRVQEKRRLVNILVVITLLFTVCNLPTIAILACIGHGVEGIRRQLYVTVVFLGCTSSCLNPYVYTLKSKHYRRQVTHLLSRKSRANVARAPRTLRGDTRM